MHCSTDNDQSSSSAEEAILFACQRCELVGIMHHAESESQVGVLIVTGGPQYRIGSHRQFVLLARVFAGAGFPTFRFDHRGSGDSEGQFPGFERLGEDIDAAIEAFLKRSPGLKRVVLWGLCDAASAILLHASEDPRVAGLVLLNPWVRSAESEAGAIVKHYYGRRLLDGAFWRKLFSGKVALGQSLRSFCASLVGWARANLPVAHRPGPIKEQTLPERMAHGLEAFHGPVKLVICGRDLTAREFEDAAGQSHWRRLLAEDRVERHDLPTADHTFSRRVWRDDIAGVTIAWLKRVETAEIK